MKTKLIILVLCVHCIFSNRNIYIISADLRIGGPYKQLAIQLGKIGYNLIATTNTDNLNNAKTIIFYNMPYDYQCLKKYPKDRLVVFLWEPPTVYPSNYDKWLHRYFSKIYTWDDTLVDNKTYFKFFCPHSLTMTTCIPFEQKKFCTLIFGNKKSEHPNELYTARLDIINFFENSSTNDFEFYGVGWPNNTFKNYKGLVSNKIECLKYYKFCIAYENMKNSYGYITEKIFDCFLAGCIPIYWGAENITCYIPKNCFISRQDFNSNQELYQFLKQINKETYDNYIENIKNYLISPQAQLFSMQNFIKTLTKSALSNEFHVLPEGNYFL